MLTAPFALAAHAAPAIRRELFIAPRTHGTAVMAYAFYTRTRGGEMVSVEERWSRSDTVDAAWIRHSKNHGRTWGAPVEVRTREQRPEGVLRRHPRAGFADPSGRYVEFWIEGILPSDDPLEGLRRWSIWYRVSRDGGRSSDVPRQVIHAGAEFNEQHPLPGVWSGRNCAMLGDVACVPVAGSDGHVLLPIQLTLPGKDGTLANPGGGYTYTDAAVLRGVWHGDQLEWEMSDVVRGDPTRSTRGMDEGTLGFLQDNRILMVLRGSNDRRPQLPGYRWFSISSDGGKRWTEPRPWSYDDGHEFFSPSSCSQLIAHPSGRLFWLGNIVPENPRGNRPRYPFVIGEVDKRTGLLRRSTIRTVDTLQPGEDPAMSLSNFFAREDRRTGGIAVHMTRLFAGSPVWSGDAYIYRISV